MKPRPRPAVPYKYTYSFLVPLTLYLEDLRDICSVLGQIGSVLAETDANVDIGSFDEIRQLEGQPVHDLKIVATAADGESVTAHFSAAGASLAITSPRVEFVGAMENLKEIAWRHWRKGSLADTGVNFFVGIALVAAVIFTAGLGGFFPWSIALSASIAIIGLLLFAFGRREARTEWSQMPMIWYAKRPPTFLRRNRDQIIINGVYLGIGTVLGFLIGLLTQNLGNR